MPRAKYKITHDDFTHATLYLSGKIRGSEIEFSGNVSESDARGEFFQLLGSRVSKNSVERLNAWCEEYLSSEEWDRLKLAVRKRRERWERYDETTTITISTKAHSLLAEVAQRDSVTYSEVLEHLLLNAVNSSRRIRPRKKVETKKRPR